MPLRSWYNCGTNHFHQADFCLAEMKKPTVLSNKCSTAWSCAEDQIFVGFLRKKSSEQDFEYLYWTISKTLFWNLFTCKGTYMIDWVGWVSVWASVHAWETLIYLIYTRITHVNESCHTLMYACIHNRCIDTNTHTYISIHTHTHVSDVYIQTHTRIHV